MTLTATIAIPARNAAPYIGTALTSVLRQEGVAIQVIIVDDASDDETVAVAQRHADERVRILRNDQRAGIGACHNRILREADTEFLLHVDADDIVLPGAVARMVQALRDHPRVGQAYCDFLLTGADATTSPNDAARWRSDLARARREPIPYRRHLLQYGMIVNHLRTYRRDALLEVGGFDESLAWAVDYDMALRLADRWEFLHVPAELYIKRVLPTGASESVPFRSLRFWMRRCRLVRAQLQRGQGRVAGFGAGSAHLLLAAGLIDALRGTRHDLQHAVAGRRNGTRA